MLKAISLAKGQEIRPLSRKDVFFAAISVVMYYLFFRFVFNHLGGIHLAITVIVFIAVLYIYLHNINFPLGKYHIFYTVYLLLLALSCFLFDNPLVTLYMPIIMAVSYCYFLIVILNTRTDGSLNKHLLSDLFRGIFSRPLKGLVRISSLGTSKKSSTILNILLGCVISLPILFVVMILLSSALPYFYSVIYYVLNNVASNVISDFMCLFFALLFGYYYFNIVYNNINHPDKVVVTSKALPISDVVYITILTIFTLLYLFFFATVLIEYLGLDKAYLASASNTSGMARSSFFELIYVSLINFVMFMVIKKHSSCSKIIKILLTCIGAETIMLLSISFSKMLYYINSYGLTVSRINTIWFLVALAIGVTLFTIGIWVKFNYVKFSVVSAALIFLVVSYLPASSIIINFNDNYQFDISTYYQIGDSAVDEAIAHYEDSPNEKLVNFVCDSYYSGQIYLTYRIYSVENIINQQAAGQFCMLHKD